jgi:hypothetical protein
LRLLISAVTWPRALGAPCRAFSDRRPGSPLRARLREARYRNSSGLP